MLRTQRHLAHSRPASNGSSRIVNNYSRMSFNFGPTLLSWMEDQAPDTYQAILDADRESQERFAGTAPPSRRPTTT